jgi:hypothetical protein
MGDDCPTADHPARADLKETPMFNNNEAALAAVRDAVDALREAVEAPKKGRDEVIVNERVVAQIKEIKEGASNASARSMTSAPAFCLG